MEADPKHNGHQEVNGLNALQAYRNATDRLDADSFLAPGRWSQYLEAIDNRERETRHEVVAVIQTLNLLAQRDEIHYGLTSSDITEVAQQIAIQDSCGVIWKQVGELVELLAAETKRHRDTVIVGRTHGQPAQLTTLGMRYASVLNGLLDWAVEFERTTNDYGMRPPGGAVGTGADLMRVLGTDQAATAARYVVQLGARLGFRQVADITRQTFTRQEDLTIVHQLTQLALLARGWATDRRLEAMLGTGREVGPDTQVGSSAMATKSNPVKSERTNALTSLIFGRYTQLLHMASSEWLEGDVSSSAARKQFWPGLFGEIEELISTWQTAITLWEPDEGMIEAEREVSCYEVRTGTLLHLLVQEHGWSRTRAHEAIRTGQVPPLIIGQNLMEDPGVGWSRSVVNLVVERAKNGVPPEES